jgi:hypothetical protein
MASDQRLSSCERIKKNAKSTASSQFHRCVLPLRGGQAGQIGTIVFPASRDGLPAYTLSRISCQ